MTNHKTIIVVILLALGLMLFRLSSNPIRHNVAQLALSNALSDRFATSTSIDLLRLALGLECGTNSAIECNPELWESDEAVLRSANLLLVGDSPIQEVINQSALIPIERFTQSGQPASLQDVDAPSVLYGPGYFESRIFLVSERAGCWQVAVNAKHDDPPPVMLEVWLDSNKVGTISYDRGDQSWETRAVNIIATPNLHWLRIWFANDYLDQEVGADRNAYLEHVEIIQMEDSDCAN